MAIYSIGDLEKLSGIKAHTIRMWEKRYSILQPKRTKTNIRYYVDEDLQRLLNVAVLNKNGYKISQIAEMSSDQMLNAVLETSSGQSNLPDHHSDALTLSMLEMDEVKFNAVIEKNIQESGMIWTIDNVLVPFLNRLNLLWMTGAVSPIQENYITRLIKQKIIVAIDQTKRPGREAKKIIAFLPEGESQELSLLYLQLLLKADGYNVINLGINVSYLDLKQAVGIQKPEYLLTLINEGLNGRSVKQYVDDLGLYFRNQTILLSGMQVIRNDIKSGKNIIVMRQLQEILTYLRQPKSSSTKVYQEN